MFVARLLRALGVDARTLRFFAVAAVVWFGCAFEFAFHGRQPTAAAIDDLKTN